MTAPSTRPSPRSPQHDDGGDRNRRRFYDGSLQATVVQVFQGDFYVSKVPDEVLATVLGSCVSACVRDPVARVGGMNHFLLPAGPEQESSGAALSLRYGAFAMEQLINAVLAAGGLRDRLEIKVFGGANVIRGLSADIGHRNATFVEGYLKQEGFKLSAQHLRGQLARKVQFFPDSGQVRLREIKDAAAPAIFEREVRAGPRIAANPVGGTIELFD